MIYTPDCQDDSKIIDSSIPLCINKINYNLNYCCVAIIIINVTGVVVCSCGFDAC